MLATIALAALGMFASPVAPEYDFVVRGGRVIDGSGNPAYFADAAIKGDRIVKIGERLGAGKKEVDAKGKIVAPGFIDVHTHSEDIAEIPLAENFLRMGVTTIVTGNCGSSTLEPGLFFKAMLKNGVSPNVATLIGQNSVRRKAMGGNYDREPTPKERSEMRSLVDRAMQQGAVGLSTGLIYMPGVFSKTDEIIDLAKVSSKYGGLYVSHMRSESLQLLEAIEEVIAIARAAGCRAEVSHIKASGNATWGKSTEALALIEKARSEGVDITQDQYVYTASSTSLGQTIPDWAKEGGSSEFKKRLADSNAKAKMVADMKANLERNARPDYAYAVIANCSSDKSLNGKPVPAAAKAKRGSDSLEDQIETILEIESKGGASAVFHGMAEDDVQRFLGHPNTMVASDGGPRVINDTVPHPRNFGNNARVLQRYVREEKVLRMEDAIRRMTSLPAQTFRMIDRGLLREGMAADVVVFDPKTVRANATFEDPQQFATGFALVMVNGVPVIENDRHTKARPGKALRLKNRVVRAW